MSFQSFPTGESPDTAADGLEACACGLAVIRTDFSLPQKPVMCGWCQMTANAIAEFAEAQ